MVLYALSATIALLDRRAEGDDAKAETAKRLRPRYMRLIENLADQTPEFAGQIEQWKERAEKWFGVTLNGK
jgi:hypothetical protein